MILTKVLINGCGEDGDDDNNDGNIAVDREVVRGISESMKLLMNEVNAYSLVLVSFFCVQKIKKICD